MKPGLTLERFRALLEAYGGRFELWPESERELGVALAEQSPEARALLEAEAELDARFAVEPLLDPSAELWRRLNEIPVRAPQRRPFWRLPGLWVPALGWALAAVVGLGWGLASAPFDPSVLGADTSAVSADTGDTADTTNTANTATRDTAASDTDDLGELARGAVPELEE